MPKLIFTNSSLGHQDYELVLEKTIVGRGEQNTLVIHDPSLSAHHCEILLHGQEVIVHDLDSRNGTFVNGARLHNAQAQLKHGQTVRFGSVEARLELEDVPEESTASDITAVYAFGRAIRDQRREEQKPKPASVSKHIGRDSQSSEDATIAIAAPPSAASPTQQAVPNPPPKRSPFLWVVVGIIILVIVGLAWRVLSR